MVACDVATWPWRTLHAAMRPRAVRATRREVAGDLVAALVVVWLCAAALGAGQPS